MCSLTNYASQVLITYYWLFVAKLFKQMVRCYYILCESTSALKSLVCIIVMHEWDN